IRLEQDIHRVIPACRCSHRDGCLATIFPSYQLRKDTMEKVRMGVIGCGAISSQYLKMASNFPVVEVAAVADMVRENAEKKAAEFNVPRVLDVDALLADESIELVLNLTVPKAHLPIAMRCLEAGKHT